MGLDASAPGGGFASARVVVNAKSGIELRKRSDFTFMLVTVRYLRVLGNNFSLAHKTKPETVLQSALSAKCLRIFTFGERLVAF